MRAALLAFSAASLAFWSTAAHAGRASRPSPEPPPAEAPASVVTPAPGAEPPCSEGDLNETIGRGLGGWESWSDKTWDKAASDVRVSLACQDDPVSAETAANLHRFLGLDALVNKSYDLALLHFKTAAVLEPGYRFPDKIIQPGNRFDQTWQAALAAPLPVLVPLDIERGTELWIDGALTTELYTDRPHYIQVFVAPKGHISSFVLPAGGALKLDELDGYREAIEEQERRRKLSNRLLVAAGGVALVAGGFELGAQRNMPDADANREEWARVLGLRGAALATLGAGVGVGAVAIVVRR